MKSYGNFVRLEGPGGVEHWNKLPMGDTAGKNEAWLRDMLQSEPGLVPIDDIDPVYGPLLAVCTELKTEAGPIDNLFINPQGRLTLIECKLWRNPESRRKVVAQILDYARAISRWSYSDLQREVNARTGMKGNYLFELARAARPELLEQRFVDMTSAALRQGRFLLVVAGDGIREDVQTMGELINRNAASGFSFGMFEVAIYQGPNEALLVQPRVVARTQLIERTVVLLQNGTLDSCEPEDMDEDVPEVSSALSPARKAFATSKLWWESVISAPLDDPDQPELRYFWPNNVRGALPWPGIWVLGYKTSGPKACVGVQLSGRQAPLAELLRTLEPQTEAILENLPEGTRFDPDSGLRIQRSMTEFGNEEQARQWLIQTINQFINELRPRVARMIGEKN